MELGDPDDVHITSTLEHSFEDPARTSLQTSQPEISFKDADTDTKEDLDSRKHEMLKLLQSRECIKLEPLVLDKDSFAETAANISTLSVLVKDGLAKVRLGSDKSYIIAPADSTTDSDDTTSIFQLNYKDWELMRKNSEEMTMTTTTMTGRNASPWPVLIPKGIRTKSRRRTCSEPDRSEDHPTISAENPEAIDQDSKDAVDRREEEAETKPSKPLQTYSRRKKKPVTDVAESEETLVKRYTRRLLDGKILVEKTFIFQELVPAKRKIGDGLFEKLAAAPKRRRTGHGHVPVSNSSALAVYRKASNNLLEGVGKGEAMIIAPKRFKKSNFRPRQLAIAQIKAKLKAILNRQAPLK